MLVCNRQMLREMKELTALEWVILVAFVVVAICALLYLLKDIVNTYIATYGDEEENRDEGQ